MNVNQTKMEKPMNQPKNNHKFRKWIIDWNNFQFLIGLVIIILLALSPMVVDRVYYKNIIILTVLYAFVAIAWNIVGGYAGLFLIGLVPFYGVGAYTTVMLLRYLEVTPWIGIFASAIPAMVLGYIVAFLTMRYGLKMDYFGLFTLAVMTSTALLFSKWELAGSAMGLSVPFVSESAAMMTFRDKEPYLYIVLGLLLGGLIINFLIARSKLGKYLVAIREDESAAEALGVNVTKYKIIAMVISAGLLGIGGGFYVMFTAFVEPPVIFGLTFNFELLVAPIIGGRGTILGPILGALLNKPIVELVRGWFAVTRAGTNLIFYGLFLIIFILFLPRGVVGLLEKPFQKFKNKIQSKIDNGS